MTLAAPFDELDEAAKVEYWLIGQLIAMKSQDGLFLDYDAARRLVRAGVNGNDVRTFGALLAAGCPFDTALDIITP